MMRSLPSVGAWGAAACARTIRELPFVQSAEQEPQPAGDEQGERWNFQSRLHVAFSWMKWEQLTLYARFSTSFGLVDSGTSQGCKVHAIYRRASHHGRQQEDGGTNGADLLAVN